MTKSFLITIFFLSSLHLYAQTNNSKNTWQMGNKLTIGNRYYEGSVDGLNIYMDDLELANPVLHKELIPYLDDLNRKDNISIMFTVFQFSGAGLAAFGFYNRDKNIVFNNDRRIDALYCGYIGVAIFGVCWMLSSYFEPGFQDVSNFINKHNILNPQNPIHFNVGINQLENNNYEYVGKLGYNFYY